MKAVLAVPLLILTAPLVRRNFAQSKTDRERSMTLESSLTSLFLERNFRFWSLPATTAWHFARSCSKIV